MLRGIILSAYRTFQLNREVPSKVSSHQVGLFWV